MFSRASVWRVHASRHSRSRPLGCARALAACTLFICAVHTSRRLLVIACWLAIGLVGCSSSANGAWAHSADAELRAHLTRRAADWVAISKLVRTANTSELRIHHWPLTSIFSPAFYFNLLNIFIIEKMNFECDLLRFTLNRFTSKYSNPIYWVLIIFT